LKPLMESSVFSSALMMVYPWSSANCPYRPWVTHHRISISLQSRWFLLLLWPRTSGR
jgi:hypothetical protein